MEQNSVKDTNEVKIRGFIVGKYNPRANVLILTVCVPSGKSNMSNYPKIVFLGDGVREADNFKFYDNVEITATIQSSRKIVGDRKVYSQSLVGQTIKETDRTLSAAFDNAIGGRYLPPENMFKLKGTVRKMVLVTDNVLEVTVETYINKRHSFVKLYRYGIRAKTLLDTLTLGMPVVVLGEVQTLKKEKDGNVQYFENMIIKELQIVEN